MERRMIKESLFESQYAADSEITGNLACVIAFLSAKLKEVPEEFRGTAFVDLDNFIEYGSAYVAASIGYARPETDEEMASRIERANRIKAQFEAKRRAEYERMKAEFG